jgi:hypothetical protein
MKLLTEGWMRPVNTVQRLDWVNIDGTKGNVLAFGDTGRTEIHVGFISHF